MIAPQQHGHLHCCSTVHLEMVKMVNFMLCIFYHNEKESTQPLGKTSGQMCCPGAERRVVPEMCVIFLATWGDLWEVLGLGSLLQGCCPDPMGPGDPPWGACGDPGPGRSQRRCCLLAAGVGGTGLFQKACPHTAEANAAALPTGHCLSVT